MHAKVRELPHALQNALASVGYGRDDISVEIEESVHVGSAGGDGYKSFATLVNLATGQHETTWGSWGGSNMFSPNNAVDNLRESLPLEVGFAVIRGRVGGDRPVYATLHLSPKNVVPWLTQGEAATLAERQVLYCFSGLKSGEYRQRELARLPGSAAIVQALLAKGWLKSNKAGAIQITTEGKNAENRKAGYSMPTE